MSRAPYTIIGLGELLWDILPSGEQLGGAPANFAYTSTMLGDHGTVVSRVGNDGLGRKALIRLRQAGLTDSHIQRDAERPTGTVEVRLGGQGKPSFVITENVAWDFLEWSPELEELADRADAICFGSLAQRSPQSRATIQRFVKVARRDTITFFDVNLRAPFYSAQVMTESLKLARVVKLNDEEVERVMMLSGLRGGDEIDCARRLLRAYDLDMVCVTRGERGSLLLTRVETFEHPGFSTNVVDTVGAGDAFSAAVMHHYLRGASLERMSDAANRLGAWVAAQAGAMPAAAASLLSEIV